MVAKTDIPSHIMRELDLIHAAHPIDRYTLTYNEGTSFEERLLPSMPIYPHI